jgi:N-acetylglucosaminyl-diphospho-decaprenol L-rhamnosyltransferase
VVVISHGRKPLLERCLASLEKSEGREDLQIIVVDNGSRDGAAGLDEHFPRAQWIRLPKNFGLTKAMNLGWRAADSELVLFLHDDTELEPGAVLRLAELLETHPDVAAVCPLLVDEGGRPAPQLGNLPPDGKWRPPTPSGADPIAVEYPRGAALMTRVQLIKAVRQIDERYGQFGADADLATNFKRASKKVLLLPGVKVRHSGSQGYTSEERADFLLSRAAYLGKYSGFMPGLMARLGAIFGPLFGFRFGEFKNTVSGQKIDGTQV